VVTAAEQLEVGEALATTSDDSETAQALALAETRHSSISSCGGSSMHANGFCDSD
jgi:hypothetical protein